MLKDVESEDAVKTPIPKRQLMRVADDIGMLENFVLEFGASRIFLRGRARTDMKDKPFAFAQDCFELCADRIGKMIGSDGDYIFPDKDRYLILDSVGDAASFALQLTPPGTECAVTGRTANNVGNVFIHSI